MRRDETLPALREPGPEETMVSPDATLRDLERGHILGALDRHDGNRTAVAAELGISVRTLYYRLKEYQSQGFDVC